MPQEIPHISPEIGSEYFAEVEDGRFDALEQIADALATHSQRKQDQIDKIHKFIGEVIDFKNLGTPGDMSEIKAEF